MSEREDNLLVCLTFDGGEAIWRLTDNAAARSFARQLPLTRSFEDFNSIEMICRLEETVAVGDAPAGVDPVVADVALYVPWNTLVFYYDDYGYNDDLIPMGHIESGMDLLEAMTSGSPVTMELPEGEEGMTAIPTDTPAAATKIIMTDPVALDQACIDLIYAQKDGDGVSLVNRIESRNGLHTLEHAAEIGLGSREYQLVNLDG